MMIVIAYASLIFVGLIDNLRGASYPLLLERFALSKSTGSGFFWIASMASILMSYNFPKLRKLYSQQKLLQIFLFLLSFSAAGIGMVSLFNWPVWSLWPFVAVFGLTTGGIGVSINVICSELAPINYRRQVLSGLHSMYGLSSMAAPLLLNAVLLKQHDWPVAFLIASVLPLLVSFSLWNKIMTPQMERNDATKDEANSLYVPNALKKALIFICLTFGTYVSTEIYISSRLVDILTGSFSFSLFNANEQLSYFFALLLLGRVSFGVFKFPGHSFFWLILSLCLTIIVIFVGTLGYPRIYSLAGLTLSWFFPTAMEWVKEVYGQYFGVATGKILASVGISLVLMHALVGFLTDSLGQVLVLRIFPLVPLSSLVFLLLYKKQTLLNKS